jgi:hypothetical protein
MPIDTVGEASYLSRFWACELSSLWVRTFFQWSGLSIGYPNLGKLNEI